MEELTRKVPSPYYLSPGTDSQSHFLKAEEDHGIKADLKLMAYWIWPFLSIGEALPVR